MSTCDGVSSITVGDLVVVNSSISIHVCAAAPIGAIGVVIAVLPFDSSKRHYVVWFPSINKIISRIRTYEIKVV